MSGASTGAANRERIVRDSSYIEDTRLFLGHWNVILRYRICSKRWWVLEGHCILRERGRENLKEQQKVLESYQIQLESFMK